MSGLLSRQAEGLQVCTTKIVSPACMPACPTPSHTWTCTHMYIHKHKHTRTYIHTRALERTPRAHTHSHTRARAYTHIRTQVFAHTCTDAYARAHTHTQARAPTQTHTHTRTHTRVLLVHPCLTPVQGGTSSPWPPLSPLPPQPPLVSNSTNASNLSLADLVGAALVGGCCFGGSRRGHGCFSLEHWCADLGLPLPPDLLTNKGSRQPPLHGAMSFVGLQEPTADAKPCTQSLAPDT